MIGFELEQVLIKNGYTTGWALADGELILWEHAEDPPAPLVRPTETPE
jgi:hypothetical protein